MSEDIGTVKFKIELDFGDIPTQIKEVQSLLGSGLNLDLKNEKDEVETLDKGLANLSLGVEALKGSFEELKNVGNTFGGFIDSYNQYEASMNGVQAVAKATGNSVSESMDVIKQSTASGLISQDDAAAAVKNLQLYGYSAQEAGALINTLTDAAVYNRQANYSVGEAVRVTTEGIRMENSVLSDAAGVTKNIAKMHEEYADSLGTTTEKLTQEQKAQAVLNGVLDEGGVFAGNAEQYSDTLAGAQARLSTQVDQLRTNVGRLFNVFTPVIGGIADWISQNKELATGILTFVLVLGAAGGLIFTIVKAVKAVNTIKNAVTSLGLMSKVAVGGIGALVVGIAGLAAAGAVAATINAATDAEIDLGDETDNTTPKIAGQGDAAAETAKKIADLRNNIEKLTRDYRRDLKQIAVNHEENLATLNQQIEEANIEYRRAIDERMAEFDVTMAKQERSHQETINELMTQLSFLQQYNNEYNRQKLAQVQFALAKEQTMYQQETAALQQEIELQNQADKEKLDTKLASLQQELSDEMAFMEKHREDLKSVQNVMLLDEVESLKERYNEQKKSYEEQIAEAGISGSQIGATMGDNINKSLEEELKKWQGKDYGKEAGGSWVEGLANSIYEGIKPIGDGMVDFFGSIGKRFYNLFNGNGFGTQDFHYVNGKWVEGRGYATGGYTGRGNPDDIAGIVHRGEYVVPANMVDQATGTPKSIGNTQNITINLSGTFATSASERRRVAEQIASALSQVNQARIL